MLVITSPTQAVRRSDEDREALDDDGAGGLHIPADPGARVLGHLASSLISVVEARVKVNNLRRPSREYSGDLEAPQT